MKSAEVIFLDSIPEAKNLIHFLVSDERVYIANSLAGLKAYEERANSAPGSLCVWVKNRKELNILSAQAKALSAQFLFSYEGLRPSEIANEGSFRGPESVELPDPRIRDLSLFATKPRTLQQASGVDPEFSVIIPVFDNEERALKTLGTWFQQKHSKYEVILVDDGSESPWIGKLVGQYPDKLTLIQLMRSEKRTRGDHAFRAGLARNAGFAVSRGSEIVFCDSDILVSSGMLTHLAQELKEADVVMPQRWQLNEASSKNFVRYEKINFNADVILSPGAFWESFQTQRTPWAEQQNYWRWTSTFLLATHKSSLLQAGVFKKSFVTYGFEDTELGLRLYNMNQRFRLSTFKTYHMHQADGLSEYKNDLRQKKRLLKISADRLFRHHPTKEVYETLQTWLD